MEWKDFITCFGVDGLVWQRISSTHISSKLSKKDKNDIQTIGDLSVDKIILEISSKYIDQDCITSEERPRNITTGLIVDPIDGTNNFYKGLPTYTHAISYIKNNILTYFAICLPIEKLVLYGDKEHVYCNNILLNNSIPSHRETPPIVSIMYNTHYSDIQKAEYLRIINILIYNGINIRVSGSPSYDIACSMLGRIDAFINIKPHQFDAIPLSNGILSLSNTICWLRDKNDQVKILIGGDITVVSFIKTCLSYFD